MVCSQISVIISQIFGKGGNPDPGKDFPAKRIELNLVVEQLRFATYVSFLLIILLGMWLTVAFADVDYDNNFLTNVFGSTNVCIYFDFAPSNYVLPAFYNMCIFWMVAYCLVSSVRASIAQAEGKISLFALRLLRFAYAYAVLATMIFTTIFAVSPNPNIPHTMIIHSAPFVNLEVALCVLQVAIVWFGTKVAWIDLMPSWYQKMCRMHCLLQSLVTVGKVAFQFNALGDMNGTKGRGLWWNVRDEKALIVSKGLDSCWLLLTLFIPMAQSLHLMCKKERTHQVILTIEDNRPPVSAV
jgi:hypothetical protein